MMRNRPDLYDTYLVKIYEKRVFHVVSKKDGKTILLETSERESADRFAKNNSGFVVEYRCSKQRVNGKLT